MNASIQSIFSNTTGGYVRVSGNTQAINVTASNTLLSYTNPYVTANVSSATLFQITSTARGIIKSANTTAARVKRLTFENTFTTASILIGDVSGVSANVTGVVEDSSVLYPIGLNALIEANVITASGQITSLQVVDSGVGYSNGDVVQYTSEDGARSGSIKIVNDGNGIGKGYYKSSKGFLSEDMYVHDGDYYQEYSYEILSKISVDRYSDMFKKVMHTAGTKFFGSALVVEEDSVALSLTEISTGQEIQFNSNSSINNTNETINIGTFNPFANGDLVLYTTSNTAVEASFTGTFTTNTGAVVDSFIRVANNKFRNSDYVNVTFDSATCNTQSFNANTDIDYQIEEGGIPANTANVFITITAHPFANDQSVLYYTDAGNTAISGLINNQIYYVIGTTTNTLKLATQSGNTQSIANIVASSISESGHNIMRGFNGITNATSYYVMDANTTGFKLSTTGARINIINFKSSNTGLTLNLSQNKLTNAQSYYITGTTPTTVQLSLYSVGTPVINITANGTHSGAATAGHYLTKTVEE
jgi:hypothetical protein